MGWCDESEQEPCLDRPCPEYDALKNVSSAKLCICGIDILPGDEVLRTALEEVGCECHDMIKTFIVEGRLTPVPVE